MTRKSPFEIIKHRHITEKAGVLQQLHTSESNKSVRACNQAKYVFLVDTKATKPEIRTAIEDIYSERHIKVTSVNTLNGKTKPRHLRGRKGRPGRTPHYKKAIVTLAAGDLLEEV
jgi:large subunit ribosomal protein L23